MSYGSCKYHPFNAYLQGFTASSARYQKALEAGCIPVVVSDRVTLPFEGTCMQWMMLIMMMMMLMVLRLMKSLMTWMFRDRRIDSVIE